MPSKEKSWPDIKYPSKRDEGVMNVDLWIQGKQLDDGAEKLWRIHDSIYDLTKFVNKHPGGPMWLELTKGTDITEAFEVHHLTSSAEKKLADFYIGKAKIARNSPFTFHPQGFYKVLKERVSEHFHQKIPPVSGKSRIYLDLLFFSGILCCILAAHTESCMIAIAAGIFFGLVVNCGHNFVHMKDSFRNYYYYVITFSVREWRISHCLSHHLFPNTLQDLEISMFEPAIQFLPSKNKSFFIRYVSWLYFPVVCFLAPFQQIINRIRLNAFMKENFLMFVPLILMLATKLSFFTIILWLLVVGVTGFVFTSIGLTAAHHDYNTFHEGDKPRSDRDWGLHQVDTIAERTEIIGNVYIGLVVFGEHTLHHLFPTLDHPYLPELLPIYYKTLAEFGINYEDKSYYKLIGGTFKQLARNKPNKEG